MKPVKFSPLSLSYIVRLFRFYYFRSFLSLDLTDSFSVDGFDLSAFAWTDLSDLNDPLDCEFVK